MTAIMLSSVALVPAATIATVATTDAAFAKSENAGGKGNGKSAAAKLIGKGGGNSGTRSAYGRGKGGGLGSLGGFFDKLTGRGKATTRSAYSTGMHPSELGNMNGALHANENAILAHIRNGNTNGPVGLMAAFAAADYQAVGAEEFLNSNLAGEYAALNDALGGYPSYADYQLAYIGIGNAGSPEFPKLFDQDIEDAYANIGTTDLNNALGEYESYDAYRDAYIGEGDINAYDQAIVDAYAAASFDQTMADGFDQATLDEAEYNDTLDALVDYWNKGDAESDNVDALRYELMERVAEYEGVGETVDALEPEAAEAEVCEGAEPCSDEDMAELIE